MLHSLSDWETPFSILKRHLCHSSNKSSPSSALWPRPRPLLLGSRPPLACCSHTDAEFLLPLGLWGAAFFDVVSWPQCVECAACMCPWESLALEAPVAAGESPGRRCPRRPRHRALQGTLCTEHFLHLPALSRAPIFISSNRTCSPFSPALLGVCAPTCVFVYRCGVSPTIQSLVVWWADAYLSGVCPPPADQAR